MTASAGHRAPRIRELWRRGVATGGLHLAGSIIFVQGATLFVQMITARVLGPAAFGPIRLAESTIGMASIVAQFGLPSVAIREASRLEDGAERAALLRVLIGTGLATALSVSVAITVTASAIVGAEASPWLRILIWSITCSTATRIAIGFAQGSNLVQSIAVAGAIATLAGIVITVPLVIEFGTIGWLIGRYVSEIIAVASVVWVLRECWVNPTRSNIFRSKTLLQSGGPVAASLLMRTAQDSIIVVLLAKIGLPNVEIGYFGFGSIVATPILLLPGVIGNLSIPAFVKVSTQRTAIRGTLARFTMMAAFAGVIPAVLFFLTGPTVVRVLFPEYLIALPLFAWQVTAACIRAMPMAMGGLLIAVDKNARATTVNMCSAAVSFALVLILVPRFGAQGIGWALVLAEMINVMLFWVASLSLIRRGAVRNEF